VTIVTDITGAEKERTMATSNKAHSKSKTQKSNVRNCRSRLRLGASPRRVAATTWRPRSGDPSSVLHFDSCIGSPCRGRHPYGGTVVNVITVLILAGLLGFALWWVIKSVGQAGQQYTEALINTQDKATVLACQANLRAIWQNIQVYSVTNGSFPPSAEALVEFSGNSRLFRCPAPDGGPYVYIAGQNADMSPANVLVFEREPVHDGRCNVLQLNGQIELLTPEELKDAVAATMASLK
jgi:hypothetical protein